MSRQGCLAWCVAVLTLLALLLCACKSVDEPDPVPDDTPQTPTENIAEAQARLGRYNELLRELRLDTPAALVAARKEALSFSLDEIGSAFFNSTQSLTVTVPSDSAATIRYTTDGSEPSAEHGEVYRSPITLTATSLPTAYHFSACAVYEDGSTSDISYRTYFVGTGIVEQYNMLVFCVDAEEDDLWSRERGIFYNHKKSGAEWERPMNIELYDSDGTPILNQPAGIRIYGGYSRAHALKSMRYIARKDYDSVLDDFNVMDLFGPLYTSEGVRFDKFEHLVIRNTGNDFGKAFIRDEIVQQLMAAQGFAFTEAVRPCLVYVNGMLYGMYWMHEPYKNSYFESRYDHYDFRGEFVVLDGPERAKEPTGDVHDGFDPLADYNEMLAYGEMDLTVEEVYEELCELLDVPTYLQMHASMAYVNNGDWPQNNNRVFKYFAAEGEDFSDVHGMDGKWYFLPHDTDWAFGSASANSLLHCYDENAIQYSPLFCALMQRDDCRVMYVTYMLDMINGAFAYDRAAPIVEASAAAIRPGLELYLAQSPYLPPEEDYTIDTFDQRWKKILDVLERRPANMIKHLNARYDLGRAYTLSIDVPTGAGVTVNTYTADGDFTGTYYTYYPTVVSPVVPVGYEFDHWLVNGVRRNAAELTLEDGFTYTGEVKMQAVLRPVKGLRVTATAYYGENNYVVLTNLGDEDVSTKGYYLSDSENALYRYALPSVTVPAGKSIVVYGEDFAGEREGNVALTFNLSKGEVLCLTYRASEGDKGRTIDRVYLPKIQKTSSYERDLTDGKFYERLAGE